MPIPATRVLVVAAAVLLSCPAWSQSAPDLPDEMRAVFTAGWAMSICPTTDASQVDGLWLNTTFATTAKTVTLDWWYQAPGDAQTFHSKEVSDLAFEPTALCSQAYATDTLYVAGYSQRTGHVLVEKWKVTDLVLGTAATPGGAMKSILSKTLRKSTVLASDAIGPIRAMAYHRPEERLWLMEEAFPHRIWKLDPGPDGGEPELAFDAGTVPTLGDYLSMKCVVVTSDAPEGGGFVIEFLPWRAWEGYFYPLAWEDIVFIVRDTDMNGTNDEMTTLTWHDLTVVRKYHKFAVWDYQ